VPNHTAQDEASALAAIWNLQQTGNFVAAFDLAQAALYDRPHSDALEHASILALASCGSTDAAMTALRASRLRDTAHEDFSVLEARLLTDLAFRKSGTNPAALLVLAAKAHERVAERTHAMTAAKDAALLWTLAGDSDRGNRLASDVFNQLVESGVPDDAEAAYLHWATMAEAALVLGNRDTLDKAVANANPLCRQNLWARTRTFSHMRRLKRLRPSCASVVDQWYRPPVALVLPNEQDLSSFSGGSITENVDVPALAYGVGMKREHVWQSLVARGVNVHVICPHPAAEQPYQKALRPSSREASGRREGYTWSSLLLDEDDDADRICVEVALGLSLRHADEVQSPWIVLSQSGGQWRQYRAIDRASLVDRITPKVRSAANRSRQGLLFADAVSYSSLGVAETRRYWTTLLPIAASAMLRHNEETVLLRKTWGDAIHGVFSSATAAARAALEITAATARLSEEVTFGRRLAFRVAAHFGTVDSGADPVEEASTFFGPQLSFAARIVPMAPPGGIFVTEPFAAQLSLEGTTNIDCHYVGTTSLPKNYARVRLLALTSRS
jgi:class 3 adenylate cyclase